MEYKATLGEVKIITDDEGQVGRLSAIVSVYNNKDLVNDIIMPGAFNKSLSRKLPKGIWAHDWKRPIAKTTNAVELFPLDPRLPDSLKSLGGLLVEAEFPLNIGESKEAFEKIVYGLIDEFSIGYKVTDFSMDKGVRIIKEADLFEWSPVILGANPLTEVISVKDQKLSDHKEHVTLALETLVERYEKLTDKRGYLSKDHSTYLVSLRDRVDYLVKNYSNTEVGAEEEDNSSSSNNESEKLTQVNSETENNEELQAEGSSNTEEKVGENDQLHEDSQLNEQKGKEELTAEPNLSNKLLIEKTRLLLSGD